MSSTPYDCKFFDFLDAGSLASARVVLPTLFDFYRPQSIIDIGCGEGAWLRAAEENGVADVLGMDGTYVDFARLLIRPNQFQACDLNARIQLPRRFDLAISLEVAEHLPNDRSETFVADLCRLSDVVLFSAAMPYQGGTDHVNEQWLEFWAILFRKNNYLAYDLLRGKVWNHKEVEFWYQQNLMVFVNADQTEIKLPAEYLADRKGLSYIHPLTFLFNAARWRPLLAEAMDLEFQDYRVLLQAYIEGERELPPLKTLSARGEHDGAVIDLFPLVRTLITDPAEEIRKFYTSKLEELRTYLEARTVELDRRGHELDRLNEVIEHLRTYLEARTVELDRRGRELDRLNEVIEELRTYLEARTVELERRADLLRKSDEIIEQLRINLEARTVELQQRTDELQDIQSLLLEHRVQIAAVCGERDRLQETVKVLHGSTSWKITSPLRRVAKRLRALRGISG
jgi:SAM-dependent methyltransferase